MAYLRPGVFVEEASLTPPVIGATSTTIAAFIGSADRGPVVPTLVSSWSQFTSLYGSWGTLNTLAEAAYMFFANGGSQAYFLRATATGSPTSATRSINDTNATPAATLKIDAINYGTWGNNIYTAITAAASGSADYFNLVVYYGGSAESNVVERFNDITMKTTDAAYAITIVNASSSYVKLTDLNSTDTYQATDNPATGTATVLTGGTDGTAPTSSGLAGAITLFDGYANNLILNAPGVTAQADVDTMLSYAAGRGDIFVVIDPSSSTTATETTLANSYTGGTNAGLNYGAVYFPLLTIADPTSSVPGATKSTPPGAAVVAKYTTTDAARGVFKTPAGLETRLSNVVSVAKISNADLDSLNNNTKPVNAIRYIAGSGIVIMGGRTLKNTYADKYISVRRTVIHLRKLLSDLTAFAVFEPNNERLWDRVKTTVESTLVAFWQQGGLRGTTPYDAFFVKCDSGNNNSTTIANGQVVVEVGVALQRPAEFIIIRISQYDSGAVVTIS